MKLLLISLMNFFIQNGSVVWQNTYQTTLTQTEFISKVKQSGLIESLEVDGNVITGKVQNIEADFKGAGYSEMRTPFYIARNFYEGFIIITYSAGKYQVELKNIQLEYKFSDGLWQKGERTTLNHHLLTKKGDFKTNVKQDVTILEHTFKSLFKFD